MASMRAIYVLTLLLPPCLLAAQDAGLILTGGRLWTGDSTRPYAYEEWNAGSAGAAAGTEPRRRFAPDRSIIDSVTPGTPVLLQRWGRGAYLANGAALAAAELDCATPVEGFECTSGQATGRVSGAALARVRASIPEKSFEQRLREARVAIAHLNEMGTNASWYTADPMKILYAAVTRRTLDGKPEGGWYPRERLDLETSLRAYTANNAWAAGEESLKGRLEAGMLADLAVLDQDLFRVAPEKNKNVKALLTIVGGKVVHATAPFTR